MVDCARTGRTEVVSRAGTNGNPRLPQAGARRHIRYFKKRRAPRRRGMRATFTKTISIYVCFIAIVHLNNAVTLATIYNILSIITSSTIAHRNLPVSVAVSTTGRSTIQDPGLCINAEDTSVITGGSRPPRIQSYKVDVRKELRVTKLRHPLQSP